MNDASIERIQRLLGSRVTLWWLSLAGIVCLVLVASVVACRTYVGHHAIDLDASRRLDICSANTLQQMKPQPQIIDLQLLSSVRSACFQQVFGESQLVDFGIRKLAFLNQQAENPVMLWMVVAITLSGVFLAGVQLLTGYRLALLGKAVAPGDADLTIEHSKLSLKSSITGVVILAISLAFFIVFVQWVYNLQEVKTDGNGTSQTAGAPPPTQNAPVAIPAGAVGMLTHPALAGAGGPAVAPATDGSLRTWSTPPQLSGIPAGAVGLLTHPAPKTTASPSH